MDNRSLWFVSWGSGTIDMNPSVWKRARARLRDAYAVLRGRKRAYSDDDINAMLGDW